MTRYYNVRIQLCSPRGLRASVIVPKLCRNQWDAADAYNEYQPYPGWDKITYDLIERPQKELA